eukprot:TRINITY_DN6511_c0_g2_i1.p1 TRINITY_DN6511_c0_g2~~TRINITY_DN6511_c0_g2_i1.p1  ORF type:complete len:556 (-),score=86.81 TRINITY_DN6511_c0_g2_i1:232-1899(-)
MNSKLYQAARDGNTDLLSEIQEEDALKALTPHKNTALHIAITYGHTKFAQHILGKCPSLVFEMNHEGNTPLHLAARGGHPGLVKQMVDEYHLREGNDVEAQVRGELDDEAPQLPIKASLWAMRNSENDTALHEALRNGHTEVGLQLLELDWKILQYINKADETPAYLAARHGLLEVVEKMVSGKFLSYSLQGPEVPTPLHAAVVGNHTGIVKLLLEKTPELIPQVDSSGKNALHFAAELNYIEIIKLLLEEDIALGYAIDNKGLSPLLIATEKGHNRAVDMILNYCPLSVELLDPSGKNALHLATTYNNFFTVGKILRKREVKVLINGRDNEGNTPMHLASEKSLLPIVMLLSTVKGVDLMAINKDGLTAQYIESNTGILFRQQMIRWYLWHRGVGGFSRPKPRSKRAPPSRKQLMGIAQNLSVVGTLLAAVTFAAAFTMPGGYENEGPRQGMPLLLGRTDFDYKDNFICFLIWDIAAAFSSAAATLFLVRGMFGDDDETLNSVINRSWYLLLFAFSATTLAFIFALDAVLPYGPLRIFGVATLLTLTFAFFCFL